MNKEKELKEFQRLSTDLISMLEYMSNNKGVIIMGNDDYKGLGETIDIVLNSEYYVFMPWLIEPLKLFYDSFQKYNNEAVYSRYDETFAQLFNPSELMLLQFPREKDRKN